MILFDGGWAQWDYQIGTFRAEFDGVIYGVYTGEYPTAAALSAVIPLSTDQAAELEAERDEFIRAEG